MKTEDPLAAKNVYALNVHNDVIHISQAARGRKGYYCLGCKKEMQAIIPTVPDIVPYFRHDAEANKVGQKCTYSDETYRHKLAKDFLQATKKIKVPAIYKFPPKGHNGKANLLKEAEVLKADFVRNELTFYESEDGVVFWGSNPEVTERNLLIRPDVTFFNNQGKPFLLIEIEATHKVTEEKYLKIKRLGIDTISVTIPKDSPKDIQDTFSKTERTRWIYNNIEQDAEYISISESTSTGILSTDEISGQLFDENFTCRAAQIKRLIRTVNRCLESEPYRMAESGIRSEISRVEEVTTKERERIRAFEKEYREECYRREGYSPKDAQDTYRKEEFQYQDLEKRYYSKSSELGKEEAIFIGDGVNFEHPIGREIKRVEAEIREIERAIGISETEERGIGESIESFQLLIRETERAIEDNEDETRRSEIGLRDKYSAKEEAETNSIREFAESEVRVREQFEAERAAIENRFREIRGNLLGAIKTGSYKSDEFLRNFKRLSEVINTFPNYEKVLFDIGRVRKAKELVDKDAYKDWIQK